MAYHRPYHTSKPPPLMADPDEGPLDGLTGVVRVFGAPVGLDKAKASRVRQQQRWRAEQAIRHTVEHEAIVVGA